MHSTQALGTGYIVYDFFARGLDLKPFEQLIFGIILSFTREGGDFTGSHAYLAERTNISQRTVAEILRSLTEKKYIVKAKSKGSAYPYYRANFDLLSSLTEKHGNEKAALDPAKAARSENTPIRKMTLQASQDEIAKSATNNKEINKEIINNNNHNNKETLAREGFPSGDFVDIKENGRKSELSERDPEDDVIYVGNGEIVNMTVRQHNTLYKLVGMDVLDDYILRAEIYATEGMKHGCHVYSFYNTIRRWLREDLGL